MASVTEQEADLLVYGGGRTLLGQNLKIAVFFELGSPVAIMQNAGENDTMQTSAFLEEGGEDDVLQPDNIQHEGGEDTVI